MPPDGFRIDPVEAFEELCRANPMAELGMIEERWVEDFLNWIGEDLERDGLKDTPERALRAWKEWTSGYAQNPADIFKSFEEPTYNEMVLQTDIAFYSHCEHHLAPFFGEVTIGYLPDKKVVGLSKLSRLVDIFAKRLQVQERLTRQIADALQEHLQPLGAGVVIKARHLCIESRGVQKQGTQTITSALTGKFMTDPTVRAEFLALAHK